MSQASKVREHVDECTRELGAQLYLEGSTYGLNRDTSGGGGAVAVVQEGVVCAWTTELSLRRTVKSVFFRFGEILSVDEEFGVDSRNTKLQALLITTVQGDFRLSVTRKQLGELRTATLTIMAGMSGEVPSSSSGTVRAAAPPAPPPPAPVVRDSSPPPPPAAVPPQWAADPHGRYEVRYWNGSEWTEHVSTSGKQAVDPVSPG